MSLTCTRDMCAYILKPLPDSMVLITDKFWGPSGAENVIGSVHMWLAEAINALQDNKDTLTTKVCEGWGAGLLWALKGLSQIWPYPGLRNPAVPPDPSSVSPQVIQGCGNPKVNPHGSGPEEKRRRGKLALQEKPPTGSLEKLVSLTISATTPMSTWEGTKVVCPPGSHWSDCHPTGL